MPPFVELRPPSCITASGTTAAHGGNAANYSAAEQSYIPADYACPNNNPPLSNVTWTWNQVEEVALSGEVTSFHIHGLQGDCCVDGGDSSDLYRFDVYVR